MNKLLPHLVEADYEKDEKQRSVTLTEDGVQHIEELAVEAGLMSEGTSLYDGNNIGLLHHVTQALRAHKLFDKDTHYMVRGDQVVIIR